MKLLSTRSWHADENAVPPSPDGPPSWETVEELVSYLAGTRTVFPSAISDSNWISRYEPGRRLMLETDDRSSWIQLEHVRACWETFERMGRISRSDVLEPGRCSAFMMALFVQLPGVVRDWKDEGALVLADAS
jgi:hypothetical protein